MQSILVSIIIPIYKVEPYVVRCIESVLSQTYRNLEVILVDDCTPDRSIELAKGCIEQSPLSKDLSFIYLEHDHNRGLSAARNTGIKTANGDYLYFLDSDDWISDNCIESFVSLYLKYPQTEVICGGANLIGAEWDLFDYEKRRDDLPEHSEDREWINRAFLDRETLAMTAWNVLIRKHFLVENQLYFVEGVINEDELWHYMLSKYIGSLSILRKNTYNYLIRTGSIMHSERETTNPNRKWIFILNYMVEHCGGRFQEREISSIFGISMDYLYCSNDEVLNRGIVKVLIHSLKYATCRQKIGILLTAILPQIIRDRIHFRKWVFGIVGTI